jgi:hypothetical protein
MHETSGTCRSKPCLSVTFIKCLIFLKFEPVNTFMHNCNIFYIIMLQIYASKSLTKLGTKLKLVWLESGSPPLSNDAISVSGGCIV